LLDEEARVLGVGIGVGIGIGIGIVGCVVSNYIATPPHDRTVLLYEARVLDDL
jgi:hypothetical protein